MPVTAEDERGVVVVVDAKAAVDQVLPRLATRDPRGHPDVAGGRDPARERAPVVMDGARIPEVRPRPSPQLHAADPTLPDLTNVIFYSCEGRQRTAAAATAGRARAVA